MTIPTRYLRAASLAALLVLATAACTGSDDTTAEPAALAGGASTSSAPEAATGPASTETTEPGAYGVGRRQETLIDASRPTAANGDQPATDDRSLDTIVLYPTEGTFETDASEEGADPAPGRFPLVVFSHGFRGNHTAYEASLRVLASAGYVVVAANYPLSWTETPGGPTIADVENQTGDVAFLVDAMAAGDAFDGALADTVDVERVGLAGHSLGGVTSLGAGYNLCCATEEVDAVAEWAGVWLPLSSGGEVDPEAADRPLLIVHGEQDGTVPYGVSGAVWDLVDGPRFRVTLPQEGHVPAFVTGQSSPASEVVVDTTVYFFDRYLKDDDAGLDRLRAEVADAGEAVATLEEDRTG